MKKFLILLLSLSLLIPLISCGNEEVSVTDRVFAEEGFSITLNSSFDRSVNDSGVIFISENCSVLVTSSEKNTLSDSALSPACTLKEWADAYLAENYPELTVEEADGLLSFSSESKEEPPYRFRTFFFEGEDRIFLLTFTSSPVTFPSLDPSFAAFARSFSTQP